jgi:hypothetical protein
MSVATLSRQNSATKTSFLLAIFSSGVALRFISFIFSSNAGGDAWAREAHAALWLQHPSLQLNFGPWLPFHIWLIGGIAALLGGNVRLAGPLLSLVGGTISLFIFYRLVGTIYAKGVAQLATAIFAFWSLHIAYSATSSSEATYLLFILLALLGYFTYRRSNNLINLALSGIFFSCAAAIRYEAWPLIFAVALLMIADVWRERSQGRFSSSIRALLVFALTSGFFPFLIMLHNSIKFHHPLYAVAMNREWVSTQLSWVHPSLMYRLSLFPGVLLLTLTPVVVAGAIYGFFLSFKQKVGVELSLIIAFFAGVQFYQIASGSQMAFARYTMTLGTFTAILGAYGLHAICQRYPSKRLTLRFSFVVILLLNLFCIWALAYSPTRFNEKFASISPILRYPHHISSLADFLRPRLKTGDPIVIDDYRDEVNIVEQALGLPLIRGSQTIPVASIASNPSALMAFVQNRHPRYLIYAYTGILSTILPLQCNLRSAELNAEVSCPFRNDVYVVYEVNY